MNTFKLETEGFKKSINLKVNVKECLIPSLMLYNSKCISNCVFSSESDEESSPFMETEDKKGLIDKRLISALELFLKTEEGKKVFNLFMHDGQSINPNSKEFFKADCQGDFYNIHSLHFIEFPDAEGAMATTSETFNKRCSDQTKQSDFEYHTQRVISQDDYYGDVDKLEKHSKYLYLIVVCNFSHPRKNF